FFLLLLLILLLVLFLILILLLLILLLFLLCSLGHGGQPMFSNRQQIIGIALILGLIVAVLLAAAYLTPHNSQRPVPAGPDGYLLGWRNDKHLFDERDDGRTGPDAEFDAWFARDPAVLQLNLDRLSEALLRLNEGRGPDILAVVEVESERAAELLKQALNRRL